MITSLYLLWTRFKSWNDRRVTIKRLSALNDHILRDIGLERRDIYRVANELVESTDRQAGPGKQSKTVGKTDQNHKGLITPVPLPGGHR